MMPTMNESYIILYIQCFDDNIDDWPNCEYNMLYIIIYVVILIIIILYLIGHIYNGILINGSCQTCS